MQLAQAETHPDKLVAVARPGEVAGADERWILRSRARSQAADCRRELLGMTVDLCLAQDREADALLGASPFALLVGMLLDQQLTTG